MKFLFLVMVILFTSCQTKTGTGMLTGGAIGAGTGAALAGNKGALIGGSVGTLGGGFIGAALDELDRLRMEEKSPTTLQKLDAKEKLSSDDIKRMSQAGISDDVIIDQIKRTESTFQLSADDIIKLKNSGVSQRVITDMIQTELI